jgi:hypothetical protein
MPNFEEIFSAIKTNIEDLVKLTLTHYKKEALDDAKAFLESTKDKLKRWTELLAAKQLSTEDFEWLVESQKDLAKMTLLKQKGLAEIRIDQFKKSLLNLIVDTVFNKVL